MGGTFLLIPLYLGCHYLPRWHALIFCLCDLIYVGLLTTYQNLCKALASILFGSIFNWAPFFACGTKSTVRFLISDGTNIGGLCQESLKASLVLLDFTARHVLLSLISSWLAQMPKNFAFLCLTLAESISILVFTDREEFRHATRNVWGFSNMVNIFLYLWKPFLTCHASIHRSWPRSIPKNCFTAHFGTSLDSVMQSKCMEMHFHSALTQIIMWQFGLNVIRCMWDKIHGSRHGKGHLIFFQCIVTLFVSC